MPFILTSFASGDAKQDITNASKLSERFGKLAHATNGEMKVHAAETENSFVIEYNSNDKNRDNERLSSAIKSLISTFTSKNSEGLEVKDLRVFEAPPPKVNVAVEEEQDSVSPRRVLPKALRL